MATLVGPSKTVCGHGFSADKKIKRSQILSNGNI